MTENQGDDATQLSSRFSQSDVTQLSTRAASQSTFLDEGEDATQLSTRMAQADATRLSTRSGDVDATQLSSRVGALVGIPTLDPGMAAPASEVGGSAVTVAYDPESDGIVLTTYEPRSVESSLEIQPTPTTAGPLPEVAFGVLEVQAETERRYERATSRWLVATAIGGFLVFGASVMGAFIVFQGF